MLLRATKGRLILCRVFAGISFKWLSDDPRSKGVADLRTRTTGTTSTPPQSNGIFNFGEGEVVSNELAEMDSVDDTLYKNHPSAFPQLSFLVEVRVPLCALH
jgi:hypothetical protein